jgi:hypothetical protein
MGIRKGELGVGVLFTADYGYDRIRTAPEFERCVSLHRRALRRRYWLRLAVFSTICIVIAMWIVMFSILGQRQAAAPTVPAVPTVPPVPTVPAVSAPPAPAIAPAHVLYMPVILKGVSE